MITQCGECGRWFDLANEDEAGKWYYGHDCDPEEQQEIEQLRKANAEYARRDAEYVAWSLGGGMAKAVLAGMEMAERSKGLRT